MPEALAVSRLWNVGVTGLVHLRTGDNSIWRVELGRRKRILRLTSEGHRTLDQLEAELDFVEHVAAGGMRVARPVRAPAGGRVVDVSAFIPGRGRIFATLFEHLEGRHFAYHSPDIGEALLHGWGAAMARLHQLSGRFKERPGSRRPEWFETSVAGCRVGRLDLKGEILELRNDLIGWLRGQAPDPLHYGMVHADFERTNFLLDDGSIQLFDFDDCCRHWYVWDIACALWVFRNARVQDRALYLRWFLDGYSAIRQPDSERLRHLSEMIRLRSIALLLHRLRAPSRCASPADRDWLDRTHAWLLSPWSWEGEGDTGRSFGPDEKALAVR